MGIVNNILAGASGQQGYLIANSLRFQSASSQYLNRTPSASSRTTWTWSGWIKRGIIDSGASQYFLFSAYTASTDAGYTAVYLSADQLSLTGWNTVYRKTTQVFRDPSAWYHVVVVWDSSQGTASNRIKIYVNGSQVTAFATSNDPTSSQTSGVNSAGTHTIGANSNTLGANNFDGYMTEINFIDGQALTPSSFGETNVITGSWVAKKYTGTYGTNGFYLKFADGTSTTTLGTDSSGNANNWTLTNFTRSAGVSDCWMYDVPSGNGSPSATQPSSNYCVWSAIDRLGTTTSGANLNAVYNASGYAIRGTIAYPSTGKWYYEMTQSGTGDNFIGLSPLSATLSNLSSGSTGFYAYYSGAFKYTNGAATSYGATFGNNDVIGVAVDCDAGTVTFYKNNTSQGTAFTGLDFSIGWQPMSRVSGSGVTAQANFGQRSFAYTPPSGFKALCTANLPVATIKKGNQYMDAQLWTGDGTSPRTFNVWGFKPDLMWIKGRSGATDNALIDTVRGTGAKVLESNLTDAENSYGLSVSAFTSNGFTGATGSINFSYANSNAATYVGWAWQAGQGTTSSNTSGSITSTVSVSTTAGFSIVTWTNTGSIATIGHGLGVAPKMIIVKGRSGPAGATNWQVYHSGLNAGVNPQQYGIQLNLTSAQSGLTARWNDTAPTSSVFTVGTNSETGGTANQLMLAYCFAEIAGFSRFGFYTGNANADGPFVYCGFSPKFLMVKNASIGTEGWRIWDSSRQNYNVQGPILEANTNAAEAASSAMLDFTSNGFKIRNTSSPYNGNGNTIIFMAFAENPFNISNAR